MKTTGNKEVDRLIRKIPLFDPDDYPIYVCIYCKHEQSEDKPCKKCLGKVEQK